MSKDKNKQEKQMYLQRCIEANPKIFEMHCKMNSIPYNTVMKDNGYITLDGFRELPNYSVHKMIEDHNITWLFKEYSSGKQYFEETHILDNRLSWHLMAGGTIFEILLCDLN